MKRFFDIQDQVSSAASKTNEDVIGYKGLDSGLDLWVIDGATSVAEEEYLGLSISDPAWFAQTMSASFEKLADSQASPPSIISKSVRETVAQYESLTKDKEIPLFAKPLAAMVWVRAIPSAEGTRFQLWSLGDCRVLIAAGSPEPLLFPALVRGDIAPHPAESTLAPEERSRTGVLVSHAFKERKIREEKHTNPVTARLGFHPDSILHANTGAANLSGDCTILAMSDGFYRLVDEYGLYTDAGLLAACRSKGLKAMIEELRAYETSRDMSKAVKKSDDATAMLIHIPALPA